MGIIRQLLREPLVHFLAIGLALFVTFDAVRGNRGHEQIVVDEAVVAGIERSYAAIWQRPPTAAELRALVDDWIREEVMYRVGIEMQLERNDPVVRRRIRQKVDVLAEESQLSEPPTEAELSAWVAAYPERYARAPLLSFEQVVLQPRSGSSVPMPLVDGARAKLQSGQDPAIISESRLLPVLFSEMPADLIARDFGEKFVTSLCAAPIGAWHGPIHSAYGEHLVKVTAYIPGGLPALNEIRTRVARDIEQDRRLRAADAFYDQVRKRFDIRVEHVQLLRGQTQ